MRCIPFTFASVLALAPVLGPTAASAQGGPFLSQPGPDLWRVSKVLGLDVLGSDGKKVGSVTDVLMDHDGHAVDVVIGVGGVLGIGQKEVALPFAQVHFTDAPRPGASQNATATAASQEQSAFLSANGGMTGRGMMDGAKAPAGPDGASADPGAGAGSTAPHAAVGGPVGTTAAVPGGEPTGLAPTPNAPPGATAKATPRPDHATVDMTADQLKDAPTFAFTR